MSGALLPVGGLAAARSLAASDAAGAAVSLVTTASDRCPACGARMLRHRTIEPAMFKHGGYGETRVTVDLVCPECGSQRTEAVTSHRPAVEPVEVPWPSVDLGGGDA